MSRVAVAGVLFTLQLVPMHGLNRPIRSWISTFGTNPGMLAKLASRAMANLAEIISKLWEIQENWFARNVCSLTLHAALLEKTQKEWKCLLGVDAQQGLNEQNPGQILGVQRKTQSRNIACLHVWVQGFEELPVSAPELFLGKKCVPEGPSAKLIKTWGSGKVHRVVLAALPRCQQ